MTTRAIWAARAIAVVCRCRPNTKKIPVCQVAKRKLLERPCYDVVFAIVCGASQHKLDEETKLESAGSCFEVFAWNNSKFRESAAVALRQVMTPKGSGSRLDWGGSLSAGLDPFAGEC